MSDDGIAFALTIIVVLIGVAPFALAALMSL